MQYRGDTIRAEVDLLRFEFSSKKPQEAAPGPAGGSEGSETSANEANQTVTST